MMRKLEKALHNESVDLKNWKIIKKLHKIWNFEKMKIKKKAMSFEISKMSKMRKFERKKN